MTTITIQVSEDNDEKDWKNCAKRDNGLNESEQKLECSNGEVMMYTYCAVPVKRFPANNKVLFGNAEFDMEWWDAIYRG